MLRWQAMHAMEKEPLSLIVWLLKVSQKTRFQQSNQTHLYQARINFIFYFLKGVAVNLLLTKKNYLVNFIFLFRCKIN